jgi:hypothetical protein
MSYADPALIQARTYLMSRGIPGNAIGIVGDQSHQSSGGYHVGNDVLAQIGKLNSDYSKRQTDKDRPGSNAAMALDIGGLPGQQLSDLTNWLIAQCRAGTADTRNIREVIGRKSPAGGIQHYDALGLQTGLPAGHDTHTHISYYRDSEGGDKTSLFRRYFEGTPQEDDMPLSNEDVMKIWTWDLVDGPGVGQAYQLMNKLVADVAELKAQPAGQVTITAELMQALGNQVLSNLGPALEQAIANAVGPAAEAAVRKVLGAVDGATPQ